MSLYSYKTKTLLFLMGAHMIAFFITLFLSTVLSMERFDRGTEATFLERLCDTVSNILILPFGVNARLPLGRVLLPEPTLILNSLAWSMCTHTLINIINRMRAKRDITSNNNSSIHP